MTDDRSLKTDFLINQAKEGSVPLIRQTPVRIVLVLIGCGIIFGVYQAVLFFANLEKNSAIKNVVVQLHDPNLRDGVAMVDVTVSNLNPQPIDHIVFQYNIAGPNGSSAGSGTVSIAQVIPSGAVRNFRYVKLGPLSGEAARMQAELKDLKLGAKPKLDPELADRFADIVAMKDDGALSAWTDFVKKAPAFGPGFIGLGRTYFNSEDYAKAEEACKEAVRLDPASADAHYCLGLALLHEKKKSEAEKEIGQAYNLAPDDPDIQKTIQDNRK